MQEFTLEQIGMQVTALQNFFDQVTFCLLYTSDAADEL